MNKAIKTGDEVVVIAGNERGKRAKVLRVIPDKSRVLVEGVAKRKHFERKSEKNPEGSVIERETPIHISNVMLAERADARKAAKAAK
jgi:large subunit ribosomal protein L24